MSDFIPVNEPLLSGNEKRYLNECIESGWISSEGPFVTRFEEEFSRYLGRTHATALCNGSAALELALAALDIGPGDEVIMPSFTIISCAAAVVRAGATPVLVDALADTWNMDTGAVEEKITSRTKAVMAVHIYGLPVDLSPLIDLARAYDLFIIEDAAEAIGQTYRGKPCGSFGDVSVFSFYSNKHITTGEGGMIVTDDDELHERCRSLRNLCFRRDRRFVHDELGWNFRMSNLQAAVGVAQLENLERHVAKKRWMGRLYMELLSSCDRLQLPLTETDYAENIYWVYGIVLPDTGACDARDMMARLSDHRIGTRPFFWPMHRQPVFEKMGLFRGESHPVSERLARLGLYLPSGLALRENDIRRVAETVIRVMT